MPLQDICIYISLAVRAAHTRACLCMYSMCNYRVEGYLCLVGEWLV